MILRPLLSRGLLALALGGLTGLPARGQTASMVLDIATDDSAMFSSNGHSSPTQLTAVGDKLFFAAETPGMGRELWVSRGTGDSTRLVKDLCPGICGSELRPWGGLDGVLIFGAKVPTSLDARVWASDGTPAGTFPLSGPDLGVEIGEAHALYGGAFYASGCAAGSCGLWKIDGTRAGAQPVRDVGAFEVETVTVAGNRIFFTSQGPGSWQLWVSDGTPAGTVPLTASDSGLQRFERVTPVGGKLFFFAEKNYEEELWVSDGTPAGTRALTSFSLTRPFGYTFDAGKLVVAGDRVYFGADDVVHGLELWTSDGTPQGTKRVTEFGYHTPTGFVSNVVPLGGKMVFVATDGLHSNRYDLWTTAGTPSSTTRIPSPPCPQENCYFVSPATELFAAAGRVLFTAFDSEHGNELWSTDGTTVRLVVDLCPGECSGIDYQHKLRQWPGGVLFVGSDPVHGSELWVSDGTAAGTRRLTDMVQGGPQLPVQALALGQTLFFAGEGGAYGSELWQSRGPEDTRLVADAVHRSPGSNPESLALLGDRLFFAACPSRHYGLWTSGGTAETTTALGLERAAYECGEGGDAWSLTPLNGALFFLFQRDFFSRDLWRTDGTPGGAAPLTTGGGVQGGLALLQGQLYFSRRFNNVGGLWRSDGTAAGTVQVFAPPNSSEPRYLTALGSQLYFLTPDSIFGSPELWVSDGTAAGTRRLAEFRRGSLHTDPGFVRSGSLVFFTMQGEDSGVEVWRTDGTAAGTYLLVDANPDIYSSNPGGLTDLAGNLHFFASRADLKRVLWRSDGTTGGTVQVKTFEGSSDGRFSAAMAVLGGKLYFAADDGVHGLELWASDGTAAGTTLVRDIAPGKRSSFPQELAAISGRLFFAAADGAHGTELWVSDGTAAGTRMIQDIAPLGLSSSPQRMKGAGGRLYFTADDGLSGRELWVLPLNAPAGCQPSSTHLCLNGGRYRVEASWRTAQASGRGRAVALTPDTGYFWFFSPQNVEAVIKVLDGQGVNGHVWVFYGALSNVEYSLTVTDTATGLTRRYFNPAGQFASVGDTEGFGPRGATRAGETVRVAPSPPPRVVAHAGAAAKALCQPSSTRLCFHGGRFAVDVTWKDFTGRTGVGMAIPLTSDTGTFWFFDPANVELVLKVLDGTPVNGKHWVFYGALSSVEYTVTVTDLASGLSKTYHNPSGVFGSVGDTGAF